MVGFGLLVVMLAVTLGACATMKDEPKASSTSPSLYKRLGGREGIALLVDAFYANLAADPRTASAFKMEPAAAFAFRSSVADQICDASGGPCSYNPRTTKIAGADWNAVVENMNKALDARKVGEKEKQETVALLGRMKNDIVGP
jgi:hemoglobin